MMCLAREANICHTMSNGESFHEYGKRMAICKVEAQVWDAAGGTDTLAQLFTKHQRSSVTSSIDPPQCLFRRNVHS